MNAANLCAMHCTLETNQLNVNHVNSNGLLWQMEGNNISYGPHIDRWKYTIKEWHDNGHEWSLYRIALFDFMVHMECWKEPVLWCCGVIKINKRKQQTNSIKCVMCTRSLFIMWSIQNEIVQTVFFYTGTFYVTTARHFLYHVRKFWMRNSSCFCSKIFDVHFSPDFNKMFVDKQAVSITVASKHAHQLFRCSVFIERAWLIILDIKPLDIHFYYDVTPFTNLRVLMLWLLD